MTFGGRLGGISPVPYCVTEPIVNAEGKPVDWIYRYCNQAFADIKDYRLDAMIGQSSLNLFPQTDLGNECAFDQATGGK